MRSNWRFSFVTCGGACSNATSKSRTYETPQPNINNGKYPNIPWPSMSANDQNPRSTTRKRSRPSEWWQAAPIAPAPSEQDKLVAKPLRRDSKSGRARNRSASKKVDNSLETANIKDKKASSVAQKPRRSTRRSSSIPEIQQSIGSQPREKKSKGLSNTDAKRKRAEVEGTLFLRKFKGDDAYLEIRKCRKATTGKASSTGEGICRGSSPASGQRPDIPTPGTGDAQGPPEDYRGKMGAFATVLC